jgi:regulator of sigma E protease
VHELGHFIVAKLCGVKCEKFYLGFDVWGLKLAKFQWGETEYGIGILPLGGYVKMLGQDDNPYRAAEEMKRSRAEPAMVGAAAAATTGAAAESHHMPGGDLPSEPTAEPHPPYDPRSYMAQSVPERMAIISAGVIMNVIFAFLMAALAYRLGVKELPCKVSDVFSGGAAWQAGMQVDDEIVQIGDLEKPRYEDLQSRVPLSDVEEGIEFVVKRRGVEDLISLRLYPENRIGIPLIGVGGPRNMKLAEATGPRYSAASKARPALLAKDRIVAVNGKPVATAGELNRELVLHQEAEITVTVERTVKEESDSSGGETNENIEAFDVKVPAAPWRHFGMSLEMGPITAIQKDAPADGKLKRGDRLVSIDGEPLGDPMMLDERMRKRAGETAVVRVERGEGSDKQTVDVEIELREVDWLEQPGLTTGEVAVGAMGFSYAIYPTIKAVDEGGPADKAGLRAGDRLLSFEYRLSDEILEKEALRREGGPLEFKGVNETAWPTLMVNNVQFAHPKGTFKLDYDRNGENNSVELTPIESEQYFNPDRGFELDQDYETRKAANWGEASRLGMRKTVDSLLMVYRFLQRLAQDQISPKMLGGPVTIAKVAGRYAEQGFTSLLMFLTMLSANLAVVNFLPIPVLDGGHMVFLIYEGITGRPPSEKVFVMLSYVGLAFILTLMLFVFGLDLGFISRF